MKKSRIKFIKELHEESDEAWKEAIEKEFPKIFKEEDSYEVGEWVVRKWHDGDIDLVRIAEVKGNLYKDDFYLRNLEHDITQDCSHWIDSNDARVTTIKLKEYLKNI